MAGLWSFEQSRTLVFETSIQKCRSDNFRGTARIRLDNLCFNWKVEVDRIGIAEERVPTLRLQYRAL
jgi:hypothetical protein